MGIAVRPATCALLAVWTLPSTAETQAPSYSLEELLQRAFDNDAELAASAWRVQGAQARQRRARAASLLPRLRLQSTSGFVPDAEGDVFNPPSDTTGIRGLGPFSRTELEFVQPLYTFGQLSRLRDAAAAGVEVERASLADKRLKVALQVKELYYGILLAQDLGDLVGRLIDELRGKQSEIEDNPALPLSGSYKLRLALLELEKQQRQIDQKGKLARAALALKTGLPEGVPLQLKEEFLQPLDTRVPDLETLLARAQQRPDGRMLSSGIEARRALRDAARSAYYPQIYLAGGVRYAIAPNRTDQHNPFVKDEFNFLNGGLFVGMRQSFEWDMLGADLDKARSELFELKSREAAAARGIRLDVQRAHAEYHQALASVQTAREARELTRQWLRLARDDFAFDPGEVKELISAFEATAKTEQDYHKSVFVLNVSVARLERTVGGPLQSPSSTPNDD